MRKSRSLGITASAFALTWLAVAGFGNALVLPHAFSIAVIRPDLLRVPAQTSALVLAVGAGIYGVTAWAAAVGLWRLRAWAPVAFAAWATSAVLVMVALLALVRLPSDTPTAAAVLFLVLFCALLGGWWLYVRSAVNRVLSQAL